jgi:cell shape-determining protein MreC
MKKNITTAICALIAAIMLSACGLSEENKNLVNEALSNLTIEKESSEKLYGELTDESFSDELNELSAQYQEFSELDVSKIKNKKCEEMLGNINALTDSYKTLYDEMNAELSKEQAETAENEKHIEILSNIINKSGSELSSIIIRDNSQGTDSENLLLGGQTLKSGTILAGAVLPVYVDSTDFALIITDTLGNTHEYALPLTGLQKDVQIKISVTINTPEAGVSIGDYASVPDSES